MINFYDVLPGVIGLNLSFELSVAGWFRLLILVLLANWFVYHGLWKDPAA